MPDSDPSPAPTLHCPRCRHDLSGLPGAGLNAGLGADPTALLTCPECGTPTTVLAALDSPGGGRGWGYFVLWVVSVLMVLLLGGCVLAIIGSLVWSAMGPSP